MDLTTFLGSVGCLYVKRKLSPPFRLKAVAEEWITQGIALSFCLAQIDSHLAQHSDLYRHGSGDRWFLWLDQAIRRSWYERHLSPPQAKPIRPKMERIAEREWVDRKPSADHEIDCRRRPGGQEAPVGSRSDAPGCDRPDQALPQRIKSIGKKRKQPKQIDRAVAFLRRELASGAAAAVRLEEKAKASGISARTLDRARARLKVISRRTGFAKDGKCWCSLPMAP
jgi:hypothetical protein